MYSIFSGHKARQSNPLDERVYTSINKLLELQLHAKGFNLKPGQPTSSLLSGKHDAKLRGRGLNFEELRGYRPGDDIRTMDWKVTNRTQKPHVRTYTEERDRQVILVVDQRASMFFGSKVNMKSVVAAQLAGLLAWRALAQGDRIGAIIFNDHNIEAIAAKQSKAHVIRLLGRLAKINQELKAGQKAQAKQLDLALQKADKFALHDSLIIGISDGLGWSKQTSDWIRKLSIHNDVIGFNIFDPAETRLPNIKQMLVSDGNMQISLKQSNKALQSDFEQIFVQDFARMKSELAKNAASVTPIDTILPVTKQLVKAFGGQ